MVTASTDASINADIQPLTFHSPRPSIISPVLSGALSCVRAKSRHRFVPVTAFSSSKGRRAEREARSSGAGAQSEARSHR